MKTRSLLSIAEMSCMVAVIFLLGFLFDDFVKYNIARWLLSCMIIGASNAIIWKDLRNYYIKIKNVDPFYDLIN